MQHLHHRISLVRWARRAAAACAVTLLTTTAAAAVPDQSHTPRHATTAGFVEASSAPKSELQKMNHPVPFAAYQRSHGKPAPLGHAIPQAPADEQTDLRQQCEKQAAAAKTQTGWIKSRFESCQKKPYDLILRDKKGTEAIGRLWFDMWTLGFAYDGSRRVDYVASVENIRVQTAGTEDATKWSIGQFFRDSVDASDSDPNPQVTAPTTVQRDELLGAWNDKPTWTLTYTSPDLGAQFNNGNQQKVAATVFLDINVQSPSVSPYQEVDAYHSAVRFDYAGRVAGKYKGTVFTGARVELVMSRKDSEVKESAQHIYDALKHPERTFPSFAGKTVPGEKEPLHRLINQDKQDANRTKSIQECKKVWGDYTGSGLQCDEYPFASTKEGSTKGDNRYSVRLITGTDNHAGGQRIDAMYTANRVLDGDPFYVKITD
ncbi:NucA/NucB deoxyribonuclease domain-containing protein [Streptomyces sp. Li-HN-5-11]|uniref:NucA/NucB deoxyribonuclease domain-containing protein n=1 Tax=Streptomyces sp. Li-HN-5-11 TaxID=3075432 RepID=UPI0028A6557E|nr:NucA/NucB deoxyribonuclease domain-containing protein [Streptomyces sp. Li-HN-5-11]WNM34962.1 NucA/NucB deoxyribonuclease domain-containing protein [Streptomyces sp. Li-HN-5-11]